MDYNKEYSLRNEIYGEFGDRTVYSNVGSIISHLSDINTDDYPLKIILKRTTSVRFPEFVLKFLVNGSDLSYNFGNVADKISKEEVSDDDLLRSSVCLMGYNENMKKLMVINLDEYVDENEYKTILYLKSDSSCSYPTKSKTYTDQSLTLDDNYTAMYSVDLGVSVDRVDEAIREIMCERDGDCIYELRDESEKGLDMNLIEREHL